MSIVDSILHKERIDLQRGRNEALDEAAQIALAIDSGRGNEKEIAKAIRELKRDASYIPPAE